MTVASWEFNSLAIMLIEIHGNDAEAEAARRLEAATERDDRGQMVVWREVGKRVPDMKAKQTQ